MSDDVPRPKFSENCDRYRAFPLFRTLNQTQLRNFVAACEEIHIPKDEVFIRQASRGDRIFFICQGEVRVFLHTEDGDKDLVTIHAPAVIGEMEALTGEARAASVQATTDVESLTLPFDELHERTDDGDPATLKVVSQIARVVARRLAAMDLKIAEILASGEDRDTVRVSDLQSFQQQLADDWSA